MLPAYLVNLDRRPDRLDFMRTQLDGLGLDWSRVSALDGRSASDGDFDPRIAREGHIIPMGLGSQCFMQSFLNGLALFEASGREAALFFQDDVELSPELGAFAQNADWVPEHIGLVQFEKWVERRPEKLLGPAIGTLPVAGRSLHPLYSRTGGAAAFMIRRSAAQMILHGSARFRFPADHLLFSPNVSPYFYDIGVAMILPGLAVQRMDTITSDLDQWRKGKPPLPARLRRGWTEINRVPRQLGDMALRSARWRDVQYAQRTAPD